MNIPQQTVDRHNWEEVSPRGAYAQAAWVADRPIAVHVRDVLAPGLNWRADRQMTLRTLQIGLCMVGILNWRCHHRRVRLALRSLPFATQRKIGVVDDRGNVISYRMIEKAINQIDRILTDPPVLVEHNHPVAAPDSDAEAEADTDKEADTEAGTEQEFPCPTSCPFMVAGPMWFVTAMALAAIPDGIPVALDLALDWTDMPSWAKQLFHFDADMEAAPGDDGADYHGVAIAKSAESATRRTKEAPIGPDGRRVPTKDRDARWGHRSVRPGLDEFFIGFDLHTLLGTPTRSGVMFAAFIFGATVRPAGSYAGDAAVDLLRVLRYSKLVVRDLNADRGYTRLDPDRFSRPVLELADNIVLDMSENQRRQKADWTAVRDKGTPEERTIHVRRIAGSYFCDALPERLLDLSRPGRNADKEARLASMAEFDDRAQYAFVRHDKTKAGTQRWAGPATEYAGFKIRCPNNEASKRGPEQGRDERPITKCKVGAPCSCGEVLAIKDPGTERERQQDIWGTTKWTQSWNRRTVVERGDSDDKFQITSLDRKTICCFGTVKHAIYYAPIAVARNLQVALRWYHDTGEADPWSIGEVSRPDFRFPEELPEVAGPARPPAQDPEPDESEKGDDDLAEDALDEVADETPGLSLNRKQRRAAERAARRGRIVSKPPKPPPRGTLPPDDQQ